MRKIFAEFLILTILFFPVGVLAQTISNEQTLLEKISTSKTNKQRIESGRKLLAYYINQRSYEKALPVCSNLLELKLSKKQKFSLYMDMALSNKESGKIEDAIENCKEAEYLYPNKIDPKLMLGKIYFENALYELAKNKFYEALEIDFKSVTSMIYLGDIFRAEKNYKTSLKYYEQAEKLRDNLNINVYLNIARCSKELGLTAKAMDMLEKIHKTNPDKNVSIPLACLYKEQGRFKDAQAKLSPLINESTFNDTELYANLASLYILDKEYDKAKKLLIDFKSKNKKTEIIDFLLAEAYYQSSDNQKAAKLFNEILTYTESDSFKSTIQKISKIHAVTDKK